jgi:uncharacterized RDD family membrane protein YckC
MATAPVRASAPTRYAGFWIRFVAALIDGVLVGCANAIVGAVFGFGRLGMLPRGGDPMANLPILVGAMAKSIVIGAVLSWLYHAYMESSETQATLGKMVVGVKVSDTNFQRISFGQATARHFSKYISAMILMIGYIIAGFTAKKQALHDMIAGTVVSYK